MAGNYLLCLCFILFFFFSGCTAAQSPCFSTTMSPASLDLTQEKLTHLRFYFHDILTGPDPTAVIVAEAPTTNASSTEFGTVVMMDDPLTEGPDPSSKVVGRAQGMYASTSQSEFSFLVVMTFVFTEGEYKGSTLSVLGRELMQATVREIPIVGGTGIFRFARGYVQSRTHTLSFQTKNAVMEYNVFVFHY